MEDQPSGQTVIAAALEAVKTAARNIQTCPACQSHRIYTALNVAYYYDHQTSTIGVRSLINPAEHGWHGCYACDHKWVSNALLRTALPPAKEPRPDGKVIDLAKSKQKNG